jgi:hypothetical protein
MGNVSHWNDWYDYENNLKRCKKKCTWTVDRERIREADLIMFSMYKADAVFRDIPAYRDPWQVWAVFSHESPLSVDRAKQGYDQWNGLFNWTIVGRRDADVEAVHGKILRVGRVTNEVEIYLYTHY